MMVNPKKKLLLIQVKFGRNQKRPANPEEISYELLHLSLMRDYLDLEFQTLKDTLPFPYDLEKVIDDWVSGLYLLYLIVTSTILYK